jgi:signal transduction histidine kinase
VPGSVPQIVYYAGSAAIPVGAALSLARSQPPPPAMRSLIAALDASPAAPKALRDALRTGLGDPTLEVLTADDLARPGAQPPPGTVLTPLRHAGRDVGALVHDPALAASLDVLHAVLRMAALVDHRHQLDEVRRSRRRLVEAADAERRRIERNIHDGVQQRLIAASLLLRRAQRATGTGGNSATGAGSGGRDSGGALLEQGLAALDTAVADLREIARGMNPPALVMHGLAGALESIAERSRVAVHIDDRAEAAPAIGEETAVTAYYVALEAVTNAEKHGAADLVELRLTTVDGQLLVTVRDTGTGGAAFVPGGGLEGLRDRVEACGGRLSLSSPPGGGTLLAARLPLSAPDTEASP